MLALVEAARGAPAPLPCAGRLAFMAPRAQGNLMAIDVVDLRSFYASPLGIVARRLLARAIHGLWPDASGLRVLGIGYATPYLLGLSQRAERVAALMPARQGVV